MTQKTQNRYKILITKRIVDSLSAQEEKELQQLMNSYKTTKTYYTKLKKVWNKTRIFELSGIFRIDVTQAWERFVKIMK